MLFIAMVFLFFALLILARVFRGLQAVWLGLAMLAFGCSIVGLAGLTPRFSNYPAELLGLPLDQPVWAARVIKNLSLSNFVRLRLWSGVAFFVGVIGFAALYTQKKPESGHLGRRAGCAAFFLYLLLGYDPLMLFQLYKYGLRKAGIPGGRVQWEQQLLIWDQLNLLMVSLLLGYSVFRIFRLVAASQIVQKRIQALFVGIGIAVLGIFFMGLFCDGQGSIFNARYMAVTLLPLGWDYPLLSPAFLNAIPFGAGVVICAVLLSMFRYGFLTSWRLGARSLDHQIAVANQAVRIALHSFKNRFLGVQMAMDLTAARLNSLSGEAVDQARVQIDWARETCREALTSLEVLQSQAQLLQVKPDWVLLGEIWEAVKAKWEIRLGKVTLVEEGGQELLWIWGDREQLLAVVENLFQNAIDALAEKTVAGFEPVVTVTLGREYEWAFFRIQDNGPGIPRQNWHRIFQPFFTTKPSRTNWGLGLTYCHRVLKLHRGYINLRSWPERGTIFEVVLRCRDNLDNRAGLKGQNRQNA